MKLRPEVQWFAEQMELALQENEHKGGWKNIDREWLLEQVYRNASKILMGVENIKHPVNVANFSMMIADNFNRKTFAEDENQMAFVIEDDEAVIKEIND